MTIAAQLASQRHQPGCDGPVANNCTTGMECVMIEPLKVFGSARARASAAITRSVALSS